jgi:2'-5' RNA ligase
VIVPVGGLPPPVDLWRERTCVFKPSDGVPAHITLVFPFATADEVDDALIAALRDVVGRFAAFTFALDGMSRFPAALYFTPDPGGRFVELIEALAERFPDCEPAVHAFDAVVPHLTVAEGDTAVMDAAEAELAPLLPLSAVCESAVLLVEGPERWSVEAHLPLARGLAAR